MTRTISALVLLLGCAGDADDGVTTSVTDSIVDTDDTVPDDTNVIDTGVFEGPWVQDQDNGDGTTTTTVVSISTVDSVYFSFTNGEVSVGPSAPAEAWDLSFKREQIFTNGGDSGDGDVEVADLRGVAFESVRWTPVSGFRADLPDDDGDGEKDWALFRWYDYDYATHTLGPSDRTWVVRTPDGDVRVRFDTYYSDVDGNSGYPTFTWSWLTEGTGPLVSAPPYEQVDATSKTDWTYVSVHGHVALDVADPANSDDWDLALRGTDIQLNGGVSGPAALTAASTPAAFDTVDLKTMPAPGAFGSDEADADADGVPEYALAGSWTMAKPGVIAPTDQTWVIAQPLGDFDKVRFYDFYDGKGTAGFPAFRAEVFGEVPKKTTFP